MLAGSAIPGRGQRLLCTRPLNSTAVGGMPSAVSTSCIVQFAITPS